MSDQNDTVADKLVAICKNYKREVNPIFANSEDINAKIIDVKNFPHLFVLSCLMDKQIKAERAWSIPYTICNKLCNDDFSFAPLTTLSKDKITNFFAENSLHRFNSKMAEVFVKAVERIRDKYKGDASQIWTGKNNSAEIIYRFLCFYGCGIKIASMAANLLHRTFDIKYTDYSALDVSPDIHVCRILWRLGLIEDMNDTVGVIYKARSINPTYPGLIDECCWEVGRNYCHPTNPECNRCILKDFCPKLNI